MQKMPQARKSALIIREVDSEILIYDQASDKAHCLNETASQIWRYCDGKTTVLDACSGLSRHFGTTINENVVWYAVDQLSKDNLLEIGTTPGIPLTLLGMSRRQMVRTFGLAALVAVPVVSSILAPMPAQAATCIPSGQGPCGTGTQCCTGLCPSPGGLCA